MHGINRLVNASCCRILIGLVRLLVGTKSRWLICTRLAPLAVAAFRWHSWVYTATLHGFRSHVSLFENDVFRDAENEAFEDHTDEPEREQLEISNDRKLTANVDKAS